MTRFWWVRHGPTHQTAFTGWRDVPADLSDIAALRRLNDHLPNGALVISSDLSRAITTADRLTGRTRLPHLAALREFDFGDWDGKHWSDVATTHPDLSRRYWEDPGDHAPPNGESWNTAAARITRATDLLLAQHPDRDLILVAHFGTILTQLARAAGLTPYQALAHKIDTLSVTCLSHDGTRWHADSINHLP